MTEQQLKKGLFRLWIVVSVCWVSYWHLYTLACTPESFTRAYTSHFGETFCIIFLPPVILLILGKSIFWIARGFKKSD
jgi:hypothetical protein